METLHNRLAQHPFLTDVAENLLELLVPHTQEAAYQPEAFVFHRGEKAAHFYLIERGKVVVKMTPIHRSDINIQTVEGGDVLGLSWLVPPFRWQFDAQAQEHTTALVLDGEWLRAEFERNHELGYEIVKRLFQTLARRLEATRQQFWAFYKMHYVLKH